MFTYQTINKDKGITAIKLVNNTKEIHIQAQPAKNKDYSNFAI